MSFFSSPPRLSRYLQRPLRSYGDVLRERADAVAPATCDTHSFEQHLAAAGVVRRNYGAPCACEATAVPHAAVNGAVYARGGNGAGGHGTMPVDGAPMAATIGDHAHAPGWNGPTFKADRPVLASFAAALAANPGAAAETTAGYVDVHPRLAVRLVAKALAAQPDQAEKIVHAVKGKKRFGLSWLAVIALLVIEMIAADRPAEAAPRDAGDPNDGREASGIEPASPLRTLWAVTAAIALVAVTTQMSASADAAAQDMAAGEIGTGASALDSVVASAYRDASGVDKAFAMRMTSEIHAGANPVSGEPDDRLSQPSREPMKHTVADQQDLPGSTPPDPSTPAKAAASSPPSSDSSALSLAATGGAAADPIVTDGMSPEDKLGGLENWRLRVELGGLADDDETSGWQELFGQLRDQAVNERLLEERPEWLGSPQELDALPGSLTDALPLTLADVIDAGAKPEPTPLQMLQYWLGEQGFGADNPPSLEFMPPVLAQVLAEQQQQSAEG